MPTVVRYAERAVTDLGKFDKTVARRIVKKINVYAASSDPFEYAKPLQGPWKGLFRFRIGEYRAIFRKNSAGKITVLLVLTVKHRKEAYE